MERHLKIDQKNKIIEAKVVIIGNAGVGKTCLLVRFCENKFIMDSSTTIGATFTTKTMKFPEWTVKLNCWDTAGQERFRTMGPMYYRGTVIAVISIDLMESDELELIKYSKYWRQELIKNVPEDTIFIFTGTKSDLLTKEMLSKKNEIMKQFVNSMNSIYFETSSKENKGKMKIHNQQ
eukprot:gene1180-10694_t